MRAQAKHPTNTLQWLCRCLADDAQRSSELSRSPTNCAVHCVQVEAHLTVKKNLQPGWSKAWMERPLDPKLLEYAVYDVLAILALYQHFEAAGERFRHMQCIIKAPSSDVAGPPVLGVGHWSPPWRLALKQWHC
jgi:hypothetical protein